MATNLRFTLSGTPLPQFEAFEVTLHIDSPQLVGPTHDA